MNIDRDTFKDISDCRARGGSWADVAAPYSLPWQTVRAGYVAACRHANPASQAPAPRVACVNTWPSVDRLHAMRVASQPRRLTRAQRRAGR
jgi:hypothetical protein